MTLGRPGHTEYDDMMFPRKTDSEDESNDGLTASHLLMPLCEWCILASPLYHKNLISQNWYPTASPSYTL